MEQKNQIEEKAYNREYTNGFAITEKYVMIDYVLYRIVDGAIIFEGELYDVIDYTLISRDKNEPTVIVLPIEQIKVRDSRLIDELNASIGIVKPNSRDIPSNPVDLPYSSSVQSGQWHTITPAFNLINGQFYYSTYLKITNLPFFQINGFKLFLQLVI